LKTAGVWLVAFVPILFAAGCASSVATVPGPHEELERQVMVMLSTPVPLRLGPWDEAGPSYQSGRGMTQISSTARAVARQYHLELLDDWPMPSLRVHCVVAQLSSGQDLDEVLAHLNVDPRVLWAQPMQRFHTVAQAQPAEREAAGARWRHLEVLHNIATGRRVTIAQIDTGVDLNHPDLAGQFTEARDFVTGNGFVPELHGTAVAGVMVARPDTNIGLVGIAPGARVMLLRACWETGEVDAAACNSFSLAKALQYAMRRDVQLINLSLTGPHDILLGRLIDRATAQGIAIIAAADDGGTSSGFPANHPGVIAVGSRASPRGQRTLLAPGQDVLTTTPNATWGFQSGASFSAAHVTGLSALLLEVSPDLTPKRIEEVLRRTGANPGGISAEALVDPCAALTALRGQGESVRCSPLAEAVDRSNPAGLR